MQEAAAYEHLTRKRELAPRAGARGKVLAESSERRRKAIKRA